MILLLVLSLISVVGRTKSDPRIVGGYTIPITVAPYQVSLRVISNDNTRFGSGFFCGGSLISTSAVLTAAHCMYRSNEPISAALVQVVGGHANLFVKDENTFISAISSFKVHELYDSGESYDHDIAIIKLKTHVAKSSSVNVINLPTGPYPVGASCLIAGWGKILSGGVLSEHLRGAYIPVNGAAQCNMALYLNGSVRNGMLCAGSFSGGTNVCQGDSGGALNCNNTVYGITSHGVDCASPRFPAIFTDVFYYRDWILQNKSSVNLINWEVLLSCIMFGILGY